MMTLTLETSLSAEYNRLNVELENWNRRVLELGVVAQGHRGGSSLRTGKVEMGSSTEGPVEVGSMNLWWPSPYGIMDFPRSAQSQRDSKGKGSMRASVHTSCYFA